MSTKCGKNSKWLSPTDPNSFSRPDEAKVTHLHLDLTTDFDAKILKGSVTLSVERVKPEATHLVLDARYLVVSKVEDESNGQPLEFHLGEDGYIGGKLLIKLPQCPDSKIKVYYATTSKCTAMQWLSPSQTAGKVHPYLFSQCQAIHCRSMVPCQDTPYVKASYSAEITSPADLTVLMSAVPQGIPEPAPNNTRVHKFLQKIPIQSYLIAIAAGDVVSKKIGPRSRVWSEKQFVDKAAVDFEDTEIMLQKAEDLCGPYVWGIYDILVLPPSFPYGGMENPCLTFATPTLLAGDKSLANVIAHEIAHSWTGNLVTNKNFEHFWLNEGFTVFTERKIVGRMFGGEPARHFSAIGGWKSLSYTIDVLKPDNPLTALVVDLGGVDPDDAFSVVPYEKGSTFLWYLEDMVGGPEVFEPFLKAYYEHFKFKSIDSYEFKQFFLDYFKGKDLEIDWEGWFRNPGMPPYKPNFDQSLAKICNDLKDKWVDYDKKGCGNFTKDDMQNFSPGQKIEFLALLLEEEPLKISTLKAMEKTYKLSSVENSEIKFRWIRLGLRAKWQDAVPRATQMVTEQGRMKFLRPIYRDLYAWEEVRETAIETFKKNKASMMHVAVQGLEQDLKLA